MAVPTSTPRIGYRLKLIMMSRMLLARLERRDGILHEAEPDEENAESEDRPTPVLDVRPLRNLHHEKPDRRRAGSAKTNMSRSATKLTIHAVVVVPILAPKMTGIACWRVMSPAFTKPTSMTVSALELWMSAVTHDPREEAR